MSEKSKNAIDAAFEEFEATCKTGREARTMMIDILKKSLQNPEMAPSPYDKAMAMQAKVAVFKTLDDLVKSDEDMSLKKFKMIMARKDSETNGAVGQTIVALLKNIRATGENGGNGAHDPKLNEAMEELHQLSNSGKEELKISKDEISECAGSPSTDGNTPLVENKTKDNEEDDE